MRNTASLNARFGSVAATAIGLSLLAILLVGAGPARAATAGTAYDDVQVAIHTTNSSFSGTYTVTAYNSTGYSLVTYETPYPAASFELPAGSYILTVSAVSQGPYACPLATQSSSTGASSVAQANGTDGGTAVPVVIPPCYPGYAESEYGFSAVQVTGAASVTISTYPVSSFPTTTVTVHVRFVNGTAAAGADVYASVLGGQWYGVDGTGGLNMTGTVGTDGTATLAVPDAPLVVTAWAWVPVPPTVSPGTILVNVGGQKVNVTEIWEPDYVGLAGSALVVPPQTSVSITLSLQQPGFWVTPVSGSATDALSTGASSSAGTSGPDLVPGSLNAGQQTGETTTQTVTSTALYGLATGTAKTAPGGNDYETVLLTVVGALALGIASASLIIVRRRA